MKVGFKNRKIEIPARKVEGMEKVFGLMLKSKNTGSLLFEFDKNVNIALTSWFVFFHFLVLWLDEKNRVVDFEFINPFRFCIKPQRAFRKFIEVPVNYENRKIIEFFVGRGKV